MKRFREVTRSTRFCALMVVVLFALSRLYYIRTLGVRFESTSLVDYMQYIDPKLLREDLLRSLYYLRDQPPLFNLFLGLMLKAFPGSPDHAFRDAYLAMGAIGALSAFFLGRRLGLPNRIAALAAALLFALPSTVLYENWLFYEYPIAVLLLVSALMLHRLLDRQTTGSALCAFGSLGLVVFTRGTLHLFLYLGTLGAVLLVRRKRIRPILKGAALPTILVSALYAHHAVSFHQLVIGGFYRGVNLSMMEMRSIGESATRRLQDSGKISRACPFAFHSHIDLDALLRAQKLVAPRGGTTILDARWKSTGVTNWNSNAAEVVGKECAKAGAVIAAAHPEIYLKVVKQNVLRYQLPVDQAWPFLREGSGNNADRLRHSNEWVDKHLGLQRKVGRASDAVDWGLMLAVFAPLVFLARFQSIALRAKRPLGLSSSAATACFITAIALYSALVVVLYSTDDHNRYRFEIMPLVWMLDIAAVATLAKHLWSRHRLRVARRSRR